MSFQAALEETEGGFGGVSTDSDRGGRIWCILEGPLRDLLKDPDLVILLVLGKVGCLFLFLSDGSTLTGCFGSGMMYVQG